MGIYDDFKAGAIELIDEFTPTGPNVTFVSVTGKTEAGKSWNPIDPTTTNRDVRMIFYRDRLEDRQKQKYMKDSEVVDGQVNALMYPYDGWKPKLKDHIVIKSTNKVFELVAINPIEPDPNFGPVLYDFELKT